MCGDGQSLVGRQVGRLVLDKWIFQDSVLLPPLWAGIQISSLLLQRDSSTSTLLSNWTVLGTCVVHHSTCKASTLSLMTYNMHPQRTKFLFHTCMILYAMHLRTSSAIIFCITSFFLRFFTLIPFFIALWSMLASFRPRLRLHLGMVWRLEQMCLEQHFCGPFVAQLLVTFHFAVAEDPLRYLTFGSGWTTAFVRESSPQPKRSEAISSIHPARSSYLYSNDFRLIAIAFVRTSFDLFKQKRLTFYATTVGVWP